MQDMMYIFGAVKVYVGLDVADDVITWAEFDVDVDDVAAVEGVVVKGIGVVEVVVVVVVVVGFGVVVGAIVVTDVVVVGGSVVVVVTVVVDVVVVVSKIKKMIFFIKYVHICTFIKRISIIH
jgi:hypothetical protein